MKLKFINEYNNADLVSYNSIINGCVKWDDTDLNDLILQGCKDKFNYADYLNKINNQNIEAVNLEARTYTIDGDILNFGMLSTSESLFLLVKLAERFNYKILLLSIMMELDRNNIKRFFNEYKNSDYVDLAFVDETEKERFLWATGVM